MTSASRDDKFVGIQISPISFIDEGVEPLLDLLKERFGINVLLIGTISWLGLKVGRRISWKLDGWPDHGVQSPSPLQGGSYIADHPEFYRNTFIRNFRAQDGDAGHRHPRAGDPRGAEAGDAGLSGGDGAALQLRRPWLGAAHRHSQPAASAGGRSY